jgi:hypothetical protein
MAVCFGIFAAALPAVLSCCAMAWCGPWDWARAGCTMAPAAMVALAGGLVLWRATRPAASHAFLGLAAVLAFFSSIEFVDRALGSWFHPGSDRWTYIYYDTSEMGMMLVLLVQVWAITYFLARRIKPALPHP